MVEQISDMPPGTLGFRVSERLDREDYVQVLVPPLRQAAAAGERLRVLYAIGPGLHMEPGALWEDIKLELDSGDQASRTMGADRGGNRPGLVVARVLAVLLDGAGRDAPLSRA